ncbi:phosphotransferase [Streptomyces sp. ISL-99]|uniref:phosphotransferase n=1 Tax=Streptomyces sp. ISL-99 TaxID=2819193 RepID=UPI001BEA3C38|nr:phosphotransferase [Streptomyces sp. ISL-99]MBT2527440.1 phosphotransferase [Streptomyces sp. ISL-99]
MSATVIPPTNRFLQLPGAVVKIYRESWRAQTERAALERLSEAGIRAPSVLAGGAIRGRQLLVLRRLHGSAPGGGEEAVRRVIPYLHRVHQCTGPGFGRLFAPVAASWGEYLRERLVSYEAAHARHGFHEAAATAEALACAPFPEPAAPHLLHNDPEPGNFLFGPAATAGLDWELAIYGDPGLDYARTAHAFAVHPVRLSRVLADHGIPHSEETLAAYRSVHLLGRLMSAVTATPPDPAAAQRHARDLSAKTT